MKKILILLLLIFLCSCKKEETKQLKIVSPSGAPSLAFLSEFDNENFETNSNPKNIIAMLNSDNGADIIVIDSVSAIKAINAGAPYKLLANLTFGNFYIASTGNDDNNQIDVEDKIVIFGRGSTPDLIFHFLYGEQFDENIEYVDALADAGKVLAIGKNLITDNIIDYVFMAEPVLSNVLANSEAKTYGKAKIYANIQELYLEKTGQEMIQASILVKDGVDVNEYSKQLEDQINKLLTNQEYVDSLLLNKDSEEIAKIYGIGSKMIKKVLNDNCIGLGYKLAIENKSAIDTYIAIFGMEKTSEEIYYH